MFLSPTSRTPIRLVLAGLVVGSVFSAQSTQTLPRGYDSGAGGVGTSLPFNTFAPQKWQWHYDSAQFNALGSILIVDIAIRSQNGASVAAFSFPSVEVVMGSSTTDYSVAGTGTTPGHSSTFSANLTSDQTTVRPAMPWTSGVPAATWISLGLTAPFSYDPSMGNDLVVQIANCGSAVPWGASIFGATGAAGLLGGNSYGGPAACDSLVSSFFNNEYVPIIRITYFEESRLSVAQSGPGIGNILLILSVASSTGYEGFTLLSGNTLAPVGSGFLLGLVPDATTWAILGFPYFPGNPFHFRTTDTGLFPQSPLVGPPGTVSALAGLTFDLVCFMVDATGGYDSRSNLVRYTFQ